MNFTYENQGTNTYLVYQIAGSDKIDTMSLGMITNNKIAGIVPTVFTQLDADKFIKYNVTSRITAKEFLTGIVNKKRLLGVFSGITRAILSAEEYMIDVSNLLIDLDYIYTDVSSCETTLICLPVISKNNENVDFGMMFKKILFSTQFDQTENCDYVAKLINYLNSTPVFSITDFDRLLTETMNDEILQSQTESYVPAQAAVQMNEAVQPQEFSTQETRMSQQSAMQPQSVQSQSVPQQPMQQNVLSQPVKPQMPVQAGTSGSGQIAVPPTVGNYTEPSKKNKKHGKDQGKNQQAPVMPAQGDPNEKEMSLFGLLTHYSKENKEIYNRQKAHKKAAKENPVDSNINMPNQEFAIPGQAPQSMSKSVPSQQNQQFMPKSVPSQQMPKAPQMSAQPMQQTPQMPVQPMQSQPKPVFSKSAPVANPSVPQNILQQMPVTGDFGETTVLGVGMAAGETTVLGAAQAQIVSPYLLRLKNNERIQLSKPVFRIGKERSYVDYFISDNTAVSRSHANILIKGTEFYIVDTNSTNHTYVNGNMLQSNVETKLEHGSKVRLANEEFEFFMY